MITPRPTFSIVRMGEWNGWFSVDRTFTTSVYTHSMQNQQNTGGSRPGPVNSSSGITSTRPVSIPEPNFLPYSRLVLRGQSVSSISPSPGQDEVLGSAQPSTLHNTSQTSHHGLLALRAKSSDAQQPSKRPPLPPSPQARVHGASSLTPLAAAWLSTVDGSGSGSGSAGRHPRTLSAAAGGSYSDPNMAGTVANQQLSWQQPRMQPQHQGQYACSVGSASVSPGGDGLLAAAVLSEDVAVAARNPYHPQHSNAMSLLLEHQEQQLQQLQQQRQQQAGAVGTSCGRAQVIRSGSLNNIGQSPRSSSHVSPGALSRSNSQSRLSELGTSPGLIEASFMGMAARPAYHNSIGSSGASRSTTLQQMMQQQQAATLAQQECQQQSLLHFQKTCSLRACTRTWHDSQLEGCLMARRPPSSVQQLPASLSQEWDAIQQQQQQQQHESPALLSSTFSSVGHSRGIGALPGRAGLHWLSTADDSESVARGLLGLPLPGSTYMSDRIQQQQQQQSHFIARDSSCEAGPPGCFHALIGGGGGSEASQEARYDSASLAAFAAAASTSPSMLQPNSMGSLQHATAPNMLFASSRSFSIRSSTSVKERASSSSVNLKRLSMSRNGSFVGMPTCLICLDQLSPDDFETGEALYLACKCKGEVALRHRSCAEKWSRIKGNTICDVCKSPILNLPEVPPLPAPPPPPAADDRLLLQGSGLWGPLGDEPPAAADYVFDCIRVTWVVLIVCILFFELPVLTASIIGASVGTTYVLLCVGISVCRRWRRTRQERHDNNAGSWQDTSQAPLLGGGQGQVLPV